MLEPGSRAAALVENLTDGILILDREGIIRWVASSAHRLGLNPRELLGRPAGEALHGSDAARFQAALNEAVAHPGTAVTVESLRQSGGRIGQADDILTFLPDTEGISGVLLVMRSRPVRERPARIGPARIGLAHIGLGETEEQLRQVVRLTHIGIFDHNHLTDEIYWSPEIRRVYGWGETEPVVVVDRENSTANTWKLIHPQDRDMVATRLQQAHSADGDGLFDIEYRIVRRDGELRWLSTRSQTLFAGEGSERHAVRTVGAVQDITERKRAERALRDSEERLKQVALVYNIGMFEHDNLTDEVYWSPELRRYWGIGSDDPVTLELFGAAIHPDDRQMIEEKMARAHEPSGDGRYSVQHRIIRGDNGEIRWLDTRSQTFFEGTGTQRHPVRTVGAMVDVTSRVMAEEALRHSLREKETLLREVHHRVKNNLQIIASLLHFQAKKVKNPEDLAAFAEGRNRLRSMILVHEKLYQSPDLSRIDFGSYIRALASDLQRSYLTTGRSVALRVAADTLDLPIEAAVPCGMILCELLTNVFKYAFPDGRSGTADVSVSAADGHMHLFVSDDGVGLPGDFDPEQSSSFGWQLIRNLTAQLGGSAKVDRRNGTHVAISFPRHAGEP